MLVDVLDHDDRIRDQHAGDHHESHQAEEVDRNAENGKEKQGHEKRERNTHDGEQGIAKTHRQPEDENDHGNAEPQVVS